MYSRPVFPLSDSIRLKQGLLWYVCLGSFETFFCLHKFIGPELQAVLNEEVILISDVTNFVLSLQYAPKKDLHPLTKCMCHTEFFLQQFRFKRRHGKYIELMLALDWKSTVALNLIPDMAFGI